MAFLQISYPSGRVLKRELSSDPLDVGREPTCALQIDDGTVSRRHADISGDSTGRFSVRDLGSKNGTYVNGSPVSTKLLSHGDEVIFGSVITHFYSREISDSTGVTVSEMPTTEAESVSFVGRERKVVLDGQRLEKIYEITGRLTTLRGQDELLEDIMTICMEEFEFERGAIAVRKLEGRGLDWPILKNIQGADGEIRISGTMLRQALEEGKRAILTDTDQSTTDPTMSIVQQGTRSAMCVPLAYSDKNMGIIYGDRISTTRRYEQEDVDFFAALAQQVSIGLTNIRLLEEQKRAIELQGQIEVARRIQSRLFPDNMDLCSALEIAASNVPGRQVSGDYYDLIRIDDHRLGFIVADVSGKGVASALLAATLQGAMRTLMPGVTSLVALAEQVNRLIYENTSTSHFITAIFGVFDSAERSMKYISAGHQMPIIVTLDEGASNLEGENSLPLGVTDDEVFTENVVALGTQPATYFAYTDGLQEALDTQEVEFGVDRILEVLSEQRTASPDHMLKTVRGRLDEFCSQKPQFDDVTLLAIRTRAAE